MPGPADWTAADWQAFADKGAPAVAAAVLAAKPEGSTRSLGQLAKETLNKVKALGKS